MKRLLFALCVLAAGCESASIDSRPAKGEVTVDVIAKWDDCVLYRVSAERAIYVARCGAQVRAEWHVTTTTGKVTTTTPYAVDTVATR
jgi:hypothetical protein